MTNFKCISISDAQQKITDKSIIVIDIRDSGSYEVAHIPGALNMSGAKIEEFVADTDKNQAIIVHCYHGMSSQKAAQYLTEQGFTEVYSIDGGFEAWRQEYPTTAA